jgi:hypothetical protein
MKKPRTMTVVKAFVSGCDDSTGLKIDVSQLYWVNLLLDSYPEIIASRTKPEIANTPFFREIYPHLPKPKTN